METKNLTLSLPKRVWDIIEIDFMGLGDTEAERIQHIVEINDSFYYYYLAFQIYCNFYNIL